MVHPLTERGTGTVLTGPKLTGKLDGWMQVRIAGVRQIDISGPFAEEAAEIIDALK